VRLCHQTGCGIGEKQISEDGQQNDNQQPHKMVNVEVRDWMMEKIAKHDATSRKPHPNGG
jgi:hypothetical protein